MDGAFKETQALFRPMRASDELEELCELSFIDEWELIWCKLGDALVSLAIEAGKK